MARGTSERARWHSSRTSTPASLTGSISGFPPRGQAGRRWRFHWRARMVIDAVEAGKDVYCEKPMAHKIDEGFAVIEAVRRTKRIVQVGMQRRSAELFLEGKRIMDSGQLGEIRLVTSSWYNNQSG